METESREDVIVRLGRLREKRPGGALAFDADGTLWSGDVGDDFFRGALAEGRIEPEAVDAIRALATEFGVRAVDDGRALAAAVYEVYMRGGVPEDRICEMVAFVCAGWKTAELESFAARVVRGGRVSERWHPETTSILDWARREGIEAFVVSASPRAVVIEAARPLGFDRDHIVAVTSIVKDDVVTAGVERPIPYAEGKVTRLRERLGSRPLYGAFGDSRFDVPLLRSAEIAVAVRPKPRLVEHAAEVPGLIRLA